jgi:hypothetical protein
VAERTFNISGCTDTVWPEIGLGPMWEKPGCERVRVQTRDFRNQEPTTASKTPKEAREGCECQDGYTFTLQFTSM